MRSWMDQAADQFRQTSALIAQLDDQGFTPFFTAPTHDAEVRRDHTQAIIERLAAWSPHAIEFPLRVYSTGPVFEHGTWAESLDVEVLEERSGDSDRIIFDLLTHLIAERFGPPANQNLVFVAGHLGLLRGLFSARQWSKEAIESVERAIGQGQYNQVEEKIKSKSPELLPLFRPSPPETMIGHLNTLTRGVSPSEVTPMLLSLPREVDHVPAVLWDLSLTGSFAYYSGLVFALYARGQGEALIKGGRFFLRYQDRNWQGTGFTIALPEWFRS